MIEFIKNWQTLLGSLVAIAAAFIGARAISGQIQQTDRLEAERLHRRFLAARAVLPLALSSLSQYARDCATELYRATGLLRGRSLSQAAPLTFPPPPIAAIETLTEVIEATGSEAVAEPIADLLSNIQVLNARLTGLVTRSAHRAGIRDELENYLVDAADIEARVSSMFDFARRERDVIPRHPDLKEAETALFTLGQFGTIHDALEAKVRARWNRTAIESLETRGTDIRLLRTLIENDRDLIMRRLEIATVEDRFRYRDYQYDRLEDAAAYALIDRRRR